MKKLSAACLMAAFPMFMAASVYAANAQTSPDPMATRLILTRGEDSMKMTIERMKGALASYPMRACLDLVEGLRVELNGTMMPLPRLADVSAPNAKAIEIRPADLSQLARIEKAILNSNLGLTPANDGRIIRLPIPSLTADRRREITGAISKLSESFRRDVRNQRHQMAENITRAEKDKKITDEERRKAEEALQKLTDAYIQKIDELTAAKEKEIMEV